MEPMTLKMESSDDSIGMSKHDGILSTIHDDDTSSAWRKSKFGQGVLGFKQQYYSFDVKYKTTKFK